MSNFIISFDCEGKWGLADCLTPWHQVILKNDLLIQAYQRILNLLDKYEIPATFAFVGAFTFSPEKYYAHRDKFIEHNFFHKKWLDHFHRDARVNNFDGWFAPECFSLVRQRAQHEIASHGFTHVPLNEKDTSIELFDHEILSAQNCVDYENELPKTFIFPRNDIGYVDRLSKFGFIGYRECNTQRKINRVVREWNIFDKTENGYSNFNSGLTINPIPAGQFLNWRYGVRARVPLSVSRLRWRSMIKDAINKQKTLHLWSHPHNFITGDSMYDLFEIILKEVMLSVKAREIKAMTQKEYCILLK